MKFIINSQTLLRKLQSLSGVLNSSNTLPILDDFMFELTDTALNITATDLETTMVISLEPSMLEEPGSITIPAKLLLDFLKYLPDVPLTFSIDLALQAVEIVSSDGKYHLTGHNAEDYPKLPELTETARIEMPSDLLAAGINKTVFATGNDELRPAMGGVFFELTPDYLTFVATDAHKLVRYRRTDAKAEDSASFIVPRKPLNVLKNLLATDIAQVTVEYNVTNAAFEFQNVRLYCRLIEGKYPAYEAVIPRDNQNHLTVDRQVFINAVKRLSPFANQSTHQIRLRISGQELVMTAEDIDYSNEGSERLNCTYDGEDMEIGFNSKFVLDMVTNLESDEICFNLAGPTRAGIILPVNNENKDEDILMLVMPVMLAQG
ncbi:MAG TPA: DNA polymerase III subunit beta [Bacteroidales bacterium]|nr:DNA polymerase III subunit beta [Bacteroidales bacterium]HPT01672.1 DNA polymerase III subunit beta [Bacteroidales bacterium]